MVWVFGGVCAVLYAALIMRSDSASENVGCWILPALLILSIAGGLFFGVPSEDGCTRYSYYANDC